jgi:hypothetical protein
MYRGGDARKGVADLMGCQIFGMDEADKLLSPEP